MIDELELAKQLYKGSIEAKENGFECTSIPLKYRELTENFDFDKLKKIGLEMGIEIKWGEEMPNSKQWYKRQTKKYKSVFAYVVDSNPL
jgi:hypothetical protein